MSAPDVIKTLQQAADAPADPFSLFRLWFAEAEKAEPSDPNAMCLATADATGRVTARIVLLKGFDDRGFIFYTNRESRKGQELAAHPQACLNFHWKTLGRQVRVEGVTERLSDSESDDYFATRPRGSRIGAWASRQSQALPNRAALESRVGEFEAKFEGQETFPRPPHWGGYLLRPDTIEFWHAGDYRLHTRVLYTRTGTGWNRGLLFP